MNKTPAVIVSILVSSAVTGAATYFITRKLMLKKSDKEIKSILDKQEEHDNWLLNFHGIKKEQSLNKDVVQNKPAATKVVTNEKGKPNQDSTNKVMVDYSTHVKKYSTKANTNIYFITDSEFDESQNSYETLYYYRDGYLTDQDNNNISNVRKVLGDCYDKLASFIDSDTKAVYITNAIDGTDYEIVLKREDWVNVATPEQRANAYTELSKDDDND